MKTIHWIFRLFIIYCLTLVSFNSYSQLLIDTIVAYDADSDGNIGSVEIKFNKAVNDNKFDGNVIGDWHFSTDGFQTSTVMNNFTTNAYEIGPGNVSNDEYIRYYTPASNVLKGTGKVWYYYENDGGVSDAAHALVVSVPSDTLQNTDTLETGDIGVPIFWGANATTDTTIELQYSEKVLAYFSDAVAWHPPGLTAVDAYTKASDSTIIIIKVLSIGNTAYSANSTFDLDLDANDRITDLAGNEAAALDNEDIDDGQPPQFTFSYGEDVDDSGVNNLTVGDRIVFAFSENLDNDSQDDIEDHFDLTTTAFGDPASAFWPDPDTLVVIISSGFTISLSDTYDLDSALVYDPDPNNNHPEDDIVLQMPDVLFDVTGPEEHPSTPFAWVTNLNVKNELLEQNDEFNFIFNEPMGPSTTTTIDSRVTTVLSLGGSDITVSTVDDSVFTITYNGAAPVDLAGGETVDFSPGTLFDANGNDNSSTISFDIEDIDDIPPSLQTFFIDTIIYDPPETHTYISLVFNEPVFFYNMNDNTDIYVDFESVGQDVRKASLDYWTKPNANDTITILCPWGEPIDGDQVRLQIVDLTSVKDISDAENQLASAIDMSIFYNDDTPPDNQDDVFPNSLIVQGLSAVTISSSGSSNNEVWFAIHDPVNFQWSDTMTFTGGTSTAILAPKNEGVYHLYVVDISGNVSNASIAKLVVDNTPPTINGISIADAPMRVDSVVTVTLNVVADTTVYRHIDGNIGGFTLENLTWKDDDEYEATFTVLDGGTDVLAGSPIPVNFTITDSAGNVSNTYNTDITQDFDPIYANYPTATITGNNTICDGDSAILTAILTGLNPWEITVTDGSSPFTLSGISSSPHYFKVSPSGSPSFTYNISEVTDLSSLAQAGTGSGIVTVNDLPVVSITNPATSRTYATDATADTLTGNYSPAGIFSGDGVVSSNSTFHPDQAGLGDHDIIYSYTDGNSCTNTDTVTVTVSDAVAQIHIDNADLVSCKEDGIFTITGSNDYGATGIFEIEVGGLFYATGQGLENTGVNEATIEPGLLNNGTYTIKYRYDIVPFQFEVFATIEIIDVSTPVITGIKDRCINGDTIKLIATNLIPAGGDGYYSYDGPPNGLVIDPFDPSGNTVILKPDSMGVGTYNVEYYYHYTTENCYSDTQYHVIDINPLPVVNFTNKELYNIEEGSYVLVGNQPGGIFSGGAYIIGDEFHPDIADLGNHDITYTYTNPGTGCVNDTTKTVAVEAATGAINGINGSRLYCYSAIADTFTAVPTNGDGSPGIFVIFTGMSNIGVNQAEFDPAIAGGDPLGGTKEHPIAFQYTGWDGVTAFELRDTITVDYIPTVDFKGLEAAYCENDGEEKLLTGDNPPMLGSGTFSSSSGGLTPNGEEATLYPDLVSGTPPHYITYEFESPTGCTRDTSKIFVINPIPFVDFNIRETYNYEEPNDTLRGNYYPDGWFSGDAILDNLIFLPGFFGGPASNVQVTYTYTDANGCTNDTTKQVNIVEKDADIIAARNTSLIYCVYDDDDYIVGVPKLNEPGGYFESKPWLTNISEDTALFDPTSAGSGTHRVTYYYYDVYGTEFQVTADIVVDNVDNPAFSNFADDDEFCQNDDTKKVLLSNQEEDYTADFTLNDSALIGNIFNPADANAKIGDNILRCVYTKTSTGCINGTNLNIVVNAVPDISFTVTDNCVAEMAPEPINFINTTTLASQDSIIQWAWNFDDVYSGYANVDSTMNPVHLYLESGSRQISMEAITDKGCISKETYRIDFGDKPVADFYWTNECYTAVNLITFRDSSESFNPIDSWNWLFLDDSATSTLRHPTHHYSSLANHEVRLIVTTDLGCIDTLTQTVYLRPTVSLSSGIYTEDFESGEAGWHPTKELETDEYSWVFGTPSGDVITPPATGTNVWYAHVEDYTEEEQSWVTSPCFDFSGLQRPMIKLDIIGDMEMNRSGAVIQSTRNNGVTWENVGRQDEGINWYNSFEINQGPGGQSSGWTGSLPTWRETRQHLEGLADAENVRFRIAFSNDGSGLSEFDGFAFDNIWIGERTKNVLLEHFTNVNDNNSMSVSNSISSLVKTTNDIIPIQYHTNFPGVDLINQCYPAGPSARLLYYGISGVPYSIVDGGHTNELKYNEQVSSISKKELIVWSLYDPIFDIEVETEKNSSTYTVNTTVTSLEDILQTEITLRVAVIEKDVVNPVNVTNTLNNVLRAMLPTAGGTLYDQAWTTNQEATNTFTWDIDNTVNVDNIYAVVFLQDETTSEVYQVATDDISYLTTGIRPMEITGKDWKYLIYPNPARDHAIILFAEEVGGDYKIEVLDNMGRIVDIRELPENSTYLNLSTVNYNAGLYFIRITDNKGITNTSKLIVTKH